MLQRRVLADILVNRRPNQELSPGSKRQLYGRALAGETYAEIAAAEQLPKTTVTTALRRTSNRLSFDPAPRSGRPRITNERNERRVLYFARRDAKFTYKDLKRETGLDLSRSTFRRILERHGIINWRCKRRPNLTEGHARKRLQFAI